MGFPVWPAKGVIRGKVKEAVFHVKRNSLTILSRDIPVELYPFQLNSRGEWLAAIHKESTPEIKQMIRSYYLDMQLVINNGEGRKTGRKSNDNIFTYIAETPDAIWRIDLHIQTRPHQAIYQEEVRKGLRSPTPRNPFNYGRTTPWYSIPLKKYVYPTIDDRGELNGYDVYSDYQLFLSDYELDKGDGSTFIKEDMEHLLGEPSPTQQLRDNDDA